MSRIVGDDLKPELRRGGEAEVARRLSSLALPAAWFAASHPDGW
jgi:hypothetical protein